MVDQTMGFWNPADAKKPTGVGFSVGGDLTNVPLCAVLLVATLTAQIFADTLHRFWIIFNKDCLSGSSA